MDSSPRPQRRFSRWQTTKRTFVLAGVAYKPTDVNTVLQNGHEQSDSARKTKKANYDKNDKNHKSILNHSTTDSVTKRRQHTSPLVAKPSAARRLCLDTSRRKDSKTKVVEPAKTAPTQEAANDAVFNDGFTRKDASVPQSTSVATTEKCENSVTVDLPLLQEFQLQLERVDLRIHNTSEDAVQQNNKCALSNISQNKSTRKPSQSLPEDKSSTVHTLPSQKKANAALDCATEGVPEAGVFANEGNKQKRSAVDDEKSSDSSSTDKENVEKDSANISVPSPSKKLKKDGVLLHNMPSATRNVTFDDLNVSPKNKHDNKISQAVELSARRSSLRNRSLLASPETLMRKRQYPVFAVVEKKTVPETNVTMVNNVSSVEMGSSFNRKTPKHILLRELELSKGKNMSINKTPLPELELSKTKDTSGSSFNRRTTGKMGSSELEVSKAKDTSSVNIGSCLSRKDQSKKQSTVKSVPKTNSARQKNRNKNKSRYDVITPVDSKSVHSDNTESLIEKNGLRDRRTLPTPEAVQQQRQYPNSLFLMNRRSSVEKSDYGSKRDSLVKQQGTSIQDRDEFSQLEQTESSSASAEKTKGSSLRNKNGTCTVSNNRPQRKKCSTSLQHSLLSSETAAQHTQQEEAEKLLEHTSSTSIKQPVGAEHMGLNAVTTIGTSSVEKETDCLSAHSVHSENIDSSSVKSSVRDRLLLPTPEEVRQYNKSFLTNSRSSVGKSNSDSKHDISIKKQQKKGQNREVTSRLDQADPSSSSAQKIIKGKSLRNKNGTHVASSKQQPKRKKCSSPLQHSPLSSLEVSEEPTQQKETEKVLNHAHNVAIEQAAGAENIGLSAKSGKTKDSRSVHVHSVHSEDSDTFSVKSGLRDRRMLPTREKVQQQRQYPNSFLLTNRQSSVEKSDSDSKRDFLVKQQGTSIQDRDEFSQLEQTELSSASAKKTKGSSLRNKNVTCTISKGQLQRKKCSTSLRHSSLSSSETAAQHTQQEEAEKLLEHTSSTSIKQPVGAEHMGLNAVTTIGTSSVEKETDCLSAHSVHSENIDSSSVKNSVRDRFLLPTPEEVLQYGNKSFLTNSRSSVGKSNSDSKHDISIKKQQKKGQNREVTSRLDQADPSSSSAQKITKGKSLRNKNGTHVASSKQQPKRKKCSSPLQHSPLSSLEVSEEPAQQRETEKVLKHAHNVAIEQAVGAENIGLSAKSGKTKDSRSVHVHSVHSEDSDSFSVKSGLRDRHMLPTPEEVQRKRQYPIKFFLNSTRSSTGTTDSDIKHVSVKRQQKTVHNRELLSQTEPVEPSSSSKTIIKMKSLTSSKNRKHTTSTRHPGSKKCLSPLQYSSLSSHETSTELTQQRETVKTQESTHNKSIEKPVGKNAENIELRTTITTGDNHVRKKTDRLSDHSVHSNSFSVKSGLRDRSMLATPEEVQRQRQYPIEFFLTNRSFEKSDSHNQQKVSGKKQQEKVVQNREPSSQLKQTEHSSVSSKIIREKSAKRNKKETRADYKSLPERKKCVLPLQHVSPNSSETPEPPVSEALEQHSPEPLVQHSSQRESSHSALLEKPVGGENIGVRSKAMDNVKDMNSNPSAFENMKKSHGLRTEIHATTVQSTLNFSKTSTAKSANLPEQRQKSAHKKQKLSEQDRFEDLVKNNRTSVLSKKSLSQKDKRQYSLPRRPVKKSVKSGYHVSSVEESCNSFEVADVSVEPIQQSATTRRKPQKLTSKKHLPQQKSNPNINERRPVGQKHADIRRPDLLVNETMVVPKILPRKRKLFEELDKAEGSSTQRINKDEGQCVIEGSERGRTRKASHVTAFDVILQAVIDTEDKLLTETEDDALGHRLVRKVMGTLKKKIKPLILDVEEIKDLQHEIRQKNSKICKLSDEIKEQKQLRAQLHKEIHNRAGVDHDLDLINVIETMKGYAQLMQAFANKSR